MPGQSLAHGPRARAHTRQSRTALLDHMLFARRVKAATESLGPSVLVDVAVVPLRLKLSKIELM